MAAKRLDRVERCDMRPRIFTMVENECILVNNTRRAHLAHSNKALRDRTVEGFWQPVGLSYNTVDQICLERHALEEQIATCRVTVRVDVYLRQIRLLPRSVPVGRGVISRIARTWTMLKSSRASLASILRSSRSTFLAWVFVTVDCSLRFIDMICDALEACVADSVCADWV